jgi:hypothetical protein
MPADLDQFGREDSHGAVIGRKCLVKLGHVAADARRSLNQINLKPGFCKIKSGLNTADPAANNHDVSEMTVSDAFRKLLNSLKRQYVIFH